MGARQTSIDCYNEIKSSGLLSERRWEIYDIVFKHGPMTSNETFDYSLLKGVDGYRHNANARMTELRDVGVVQELGTTICSKTGRTVILWDVTDNLPTKLSLTKKKGKKEKIKDAMLMIKDLGESLASEADKVVLRKIYLAVKDI